MAMRVDDWERLIPEQKIERLKDGILDVNRRLDVVIDQINRSLSDVKGQIGALGQTVTEIGAAVKELEEKVSKRPDGGTF